MLLRLSPVEITRLTASCTAFERLKDGRPAVPASLLERLKLVTIEEAWDTLRKNGYHNQFAGEWFQTHPDRVLVGRAVTAAVLPSRPDLNAVVNDIGARAGLSGKQNTWVIEELELNDVLVVDFFGKVADGTFIGDNLATSVREKTRAGAVIDGGIRDLPGITKMDDLAVFCRGVHPTAINDFAMLGVNIPVMIRGITVIPGDVVLGTRTGVIFIPPHLLEEVVEKSEATRLRDAFSKQRLREQRYGPSQLDREDWAEDILADFAEWHTQRGTATELD